MGSPLTKTPAHIRRARRLSLFCREVKRALFNRSLDDNVGTGQIDFFIEDLFTLMDDHDCEYPIEVLISMLTKPEFHDETMRRYQTYLS